MKVRILIQLLVITLVLKGFGQLEKKGNYKELKQNYNFILNNKLYSNNDYLKKTYNPYTKQIDKRKDKFKENKGTIQRLDSIVELNLWKEVYTYDANGNNTQIIGFSWDSDLNKLVIESRLEIFYNTNGNYTQIIEYVWDSGQNTWVGLQKIQYTYDINENITQELYYSWKSNQWVYGLKINLTYDINDNITQELYYYWDLDQNVWDNSFKFDYTYDVNGNNTQTIICYWDSYIDSWIINAKDDKTYDSNGNNTQTIHSMWDLDQNIWIISYKQDYAYDSNGNNTQEISYSWESDQNTWVGESKHDNIYDSNFTIDDLNVPFWADFKNKLVSSINYYYDTSSSLWILDGEQIYYYSVVSSVLEIEFNKNKVTVFPNPSRGDVTVEYNMPQQGETYFDLYNVLGVKVLSERLDLYNNKSIRLKGLEEGVYIYNLRVENEIIESNRLIILK